MMSAFVNVKRLTAVLIPLIFSVSTAKAALTGGLLPDSAFSASTPPGFTIAQAQAISTLYTSCSAINIQMQTLTGSIGSMMMPGGGPVCAVQGMISTETPCPGTDGGDSLSQGGMGMGMGMMGMGGMGMMGMPMGMGMGMGGMGMGGGMSSMCSMMGPETIQQQKMMLAQMFCTNSCKSAKAQALQQELSCLNNASDNLAAQVQSLQSVFANNKQVWEKTMQNYKMNQADVREKTQRAMEILQGTPARPGLVEMQNELSQYIKGIGAEITTIENQHNQYRAMSKRHDAEILRFRQEKVMSCFSSTPVGSYKCSPNGDPVSPKDYILCLVEQNARLGNRGTIEQGAITKSNAHSTRSSLDTILSQLVNSGTPGAEAAANQNGETAPVTKSFMTVSQLLNNFGKQLAGFKIRGTNARDFITQSLKYCDKSAEDYVANALNDPGTTVGNGAKTLNDMKVVINQAYSTSIADSRQMYSRSISSLTGEAPPLDASRCAAEGITNSALLFSTQKNCLSSVREKMYNILYGKGSVANIKMTIQGNGVNPPVQFNCAGLTGCTQAVNNLVTNLGNHDKKLESARSAYALQSRQQTDAFIQQVAGQLSAQSMMLAQKMQSLKKAMGSYNIGMQQPPTVGNEQLKADEDGLYELPNDLMKVIGGKVTPPMVDTSKGTFQDATERIAEKKDKADNNLALIGRQLAQLEGMPKACAQAQSQDYLNSLMEQPSPEGCHAHELCKNGADRLMGAISDLGSHPGAMGSGAVASLQTGVQTACDPGQSVGENRNQIDELKDEYRALKTKTNRTPAEEAELLKLRETMALLKQKGLVNRGQSLASDRFGGKQACQTYLLGAKNAVNKVNEIYAIHGLPTRTRSFGGR